MALATAWAGMALVMAWAGTALVMASAGTALAHAEEVHKEREADWKEGTLQVESAEQPLAAWRIDL